jgi:hypothetical protein
MDEGRELGRCADTPAHVCMHPGPCHLAVNMSAHRLSERLNVVRDRMLAPLAQPGRVRHQRSQRRFESMGEVGSAATRALNLLRLHFNQRVDFIDKRLNLDGCRLR